MEYMLYGKTPQAACGGAIMKTVSEKKPENPAGRDGGTGRQTDCRTGRAFFCVCTAMRARQDISAGSGK